MSDFFTRLAERTLGLALIIQPIKPSLFAPQLDSIGEMLFEITEEGAVAQMPSNIQQRTDMPAQADSAEVHAAQFEHSYARQSLTTMTPDPTYSAKGHTTQLEGSRVEPTAASVQESTNYVPTGMPINSVNDPRPYDRPNPRQLVDRRWEPEREPVSPQMARARTFTPVIHEIEVQAQQSRTPSQLFAQSQTHAELHNEASLPRHVRREHDSGVSGRSNTAGSANTSGTHRETAEVLETSTLLHEQTVSRHVFLSERRRSPQLSVPPSPAQVQLESTTSEPTIQVTIGRVEVRAVSASPPITRSQQQPAKPSAMSLDEYLRRQQQGGRR